MLSVLLAAAGPFILNMLIGVVKMTKGVQSTAGKRFVLAIFSIAGAVAFGILTGSPVDWDSVGSLVTTAIESFVAFLAAHGSYSLFFNKKKSEIDRTIELSL